MHQCLFSHFSEGLPPSADGRNTETYMGGEGRGGKGRGGEEKEREGEGRGREEGRGRVNKGEVKKKRWRRGERTNTLALWNFKVWEKTN